MRDDIQAAGTLLFIAAQRRGGVADPLKYVAENPVQFPFLLDEDRTVTKAYGVYHMLGVDALHIAHPATFVIAADKTIRYIYVGSHQADRAPMEDVLKALRDAQKLSQ
jgi:peroxiredoxin